MHDHYDTSILEFILAGTITVACLNIPGSIHDSQIAKWGGICQKKSDVYKQNGGKCTVDSAFSKQKYNFFIKLSQSLPVGDREDILVGEQLLMR